jgi:hypothetical protein
MERGHTCDETQVHSVAQGQIPSRSPSGDMLGRQGGRLISIEQ